MTLPAAHKLASWDQSHPTPWRESVRKMQAAGFSTSEICTVLNIRPAELYKAQTPEPPPAPIPRHGTVSLEALREMIAEGRSYRELAPLCNLRPETVYNRLRSGWDMERALSTPVIDCAAAGRISAQRRRRDECDFLL